jgi:hypothetical protein
VNALGGFDWSFKLPKNANLGTVLCGYKLPVRLQKTLTTIAFSVQEFRGPNLKSKRRTKVKALSSLGEAVGVAERELLRGGGLRDAPIKWTVRATTTQFTSAQTVDDFTVGEWAPRGAGITTTHRRGSI